MPFFILDPTPMTSAMLISSTVPETDHPEYNAGTTYALGDKRISTTTHRIYESLRAANTGNDPTLIDNRVGATPWWADIGPTNRWAMFDDQISTQTVATSPLVVVLQPGLLNSLDLEALDGEALQLVVKDAPGGTVILDTGVVSLEGSAPADYYEHFFSMFQPLREYLAQGIPEYSTCEVTLTITSGGTVKVGACLFGDLVPIGLTQRGAKAKPKTYSRIARNARGENEIIRGKSAKDLSLSVVVDIDEANSIVRLLTGVLDKPVLFIGTEIPKYEWLRAYGLGRFDFADENALECKLIVDVDGVI